MDKCKFDVPWMGICGRPTSNNKSYCETHLMSCVECGKNKATHGCTFASSMSCGAPLCDLDECRERHDSKHL